MKACGYSNNGSRIPIVAMILANPTKPTSQRKREPVYAKLPTNEIPSSSDLEIRSLKTDENIPLSYLLQENATTIETRFGRVQRGASLFYHVKHYQEPLPAEVGPCGETDFPLVKDFNIDEEYKCCNNFAPITYEQAHILEKNTIRQFNCEEWIVERKKRITASRFGRIAKRKRDFTEEFVVSIMDPPKFKSSATSYGISSESIAKQRYTQTHRDYHVHDCGLFINPHYSFLGATPDDKVCINGETGIIKIKCPYSVRDLDINEALETANFCLEKVDGSDQVTLKSTHEYYYQVQGQLFVTCAPFCEFIVNT